jgi:hypothetical protein
MAAYVTYYPPATPDVATTASGAGSTGMPESAMVRLVHPWLWLWALALALGFGLWALALALALALADRRECGTMSVAFAAILRWQRMPLNLRPTRFGRVHGAPQAAVKGARWRRGGRFAMSSGAWSMLHGASCMLQVAWCMYVIWCMLHAACCMLHLARKVNGSNGSTWCGEGVDTDNFPCGFSYNYPFNSTKCYDQTVPTCAVKGAHLAVRCGTVALSDAPCLFDSATDSVLTPFALSVLYGYSTGSYTACRARLRAAVAQVPQS